MNLRLLLIYSLVLVSCVTVNIYFPAAEVQDAADQIVHEVWGTANGVEKDIHVGPKSEPRSSISDFFIKNAHAEQDINISTPEIRAIKNSIKARSGYLKPFLDQGAVGIGSDGLLVVRDMKAVPVKDRAGIKQAVQKENQDRQALYSAIASANGFPGKVNDVQSIFAKSWRDQAESGWNIQKPNGSWTRK